MKIAYSRENKDVITGGIDYTVSLQMQKVEKLKSEHNLVKLIGEETVLNPELEQEMVTFAENIQSVPDNDILMYFATKTAEWSIYCSLSQSCSTVNNAILMRLINVAKPPEYTVAAEAMLAFIECRPFTYEGKTYNYCLDAELEKYRKSQQR